MLTHRPCGQQWMLNFKMTGQCVSVESVKLLGLAAGAGCKVQSPCVWLKNSVIFLWKNLYMVGWGGTHFWKTSSAIFNVYLRVTSLLFEILSYFSALCNWASKIKGIWPDFLLKIQSLWSSFGGMEFILNTIFSRDITSLIAIVHTLTLFWMTRLITSIARSLWKVLTFVFMW